MQEFCIYCINPEKKMTFINFSPKVAVYEAFSSLKYLSLHPNILKILFYEKKSFSLLQQPTGGNR